MKAGVLEGNLRNAFTFVMREDHPESQLIFRRSGERANRSSITGRIVRQFLLEHVYPKLVASRIGITPQIPEVLHQHKRSIVFRLLEGRVLNYAANNRGAPCRSAFV